MDLDLFTRYLDTFGADFRRWPEAGRAAAERLCGTSPEARQRREAAGRLDALFALDRTTVMDVSAHAAIIDTTLRRIRGLQEQSFDWRWLFARPMRAALATTLVAGFLVGFLVEPQIQPSQAPGMLAVTALLDDGSADLEGLFR